MYLLCEEMYHGQNIGTHGSDVIWFPRYGKFKEIHVPVPELEYRIQNTTLESGYLVHLTYYSLGNHLMSNIICYD